MMITEKQIKKLRKAFGKSYDMPNHEFDDLISCCVWALVIVAVWLIVCGGIYWLGRLLFK